MRSSFLRVGILVAVTIAILSSATSSLLHAQAVGAAEIAPRYHLLSDSTGNLVVYTGHDITFVAGIHSPGLVARAKALVRERGARPVRYALLMESDRSPSYGDGGWGAEGVTTLAHEMLYVRMRRASRLADKDSTAFTNALPAMGFSRVVQLFLKGEEPHLVHERPATTDGDVIIHFEDAGLLMLGGLFDSDGYPAIQKSRGGNVAGLVRWVDWFADSFDASKVEPIVPGRGPVASLAELRSYRAMLTTVRDRVKALRDSGRTVDQVVASKPSAEFDARWGKGPVSPAAFVRAVYESLP